MLDRDVGRGDQNRLRVTERVEAILPVVVADSSCPRTAEGHRLDEKVNVGHVYSAAAEGKFTDEPVDLFLVTAEDVSSKGMGCRRHFCHRIVERLVGQDRENRTKDFILHDLVFPGDWIEERGIKIGRILI